MRTSCPVAISASAKCEPTKPAPPVTRIFFFVICLSSLSSVYNSSHHRRFSKIFLNCAVRLLRTFCRCGIASYYPFSEFRKGVCILRRTRVMGRNTQMLGGKTQRECRIKWFESGHLTVEPFLRVLAETICPTDASPYVANLESAKPFNSGVEAMIFVMEPLANSEALRKFPGSHFRRAILT